MPIPFIATFLIFLSLLLNSQAHRGVAEASPEILRPESMLIKGSQAFYLLVLYLFS